MTQLGCAFTAKNYGQSWTSCNDPLPARQPSQGNPTVMTMTDEKVKRLPVRFKTALGEKRTLFSPYEVGKPSACTHRNFLVDERSAVVECGQCGEKLNPMWVLQQLARDDARFHQAARQ